MNSKKIFEQLQEKLNSAPCSYKDEDWYKEGIKAAQERIVKRIYCK